MLLGGSKCWALQRKKKGKDGICCCLQTLTLLHWLVCSICWSLVQVSAKKNASHTGYYHHYNFLLQSKKKHQSFPQLSHKMLEMQLFLIGKYAVLPFLRYSNFLQNWCGSSQICCGKKCTAPTAWNAKFFLSSESEPLITGKR